MWYEGWLSQFKKKYFHIKYLVFQSKVLFYSIDGRLIGKYVPDSNFGWNSINWNSARNLIAFGDCFGEVSIKIY